MRTPFHHVATYRSGEGSKLPHETTDNILWRLEATSGRELQYKASEALLTDRYQQTSGIATFLIGDTIKVKLKASWYDSTSLFLFFSPNEERSSMLVRT